MKKWIYLIVLTCILLLGDFLLADTFKLHPTFRISTMFLSVLTFTYFRLDHWVPKEWKAQVALVKIASRLLLSLGFIAVLIYTQEDVQVMVIQFIVLYLIFMVFEIVVSLTNLRRN